MSNQAKFDTLRETFESFCFQDFHYSVENGEFFAEFDFVLSPYCHFDRKPKAGAEKSHCVQAGVRGRQRRSADDPSRAEPWPSQWHSR